MNKQFFCPIFSVFSPQSTTTNSNYWIKVSHCLHFLVLFWLHLVNYHKAFFSALLCSFAANDTAAWYSGQSAPRGRVSKGGFLSCQCVDTSRCQDKKRVFEKRMTNFKPPRQGGESVFRCGTAADRLLCTCSAGQSASALHPGRHRTSSSRSR